MYDFPTAPVEDQEYTPPTGGQTYIYKSPRWVVKGIPPAGDNIPEAPVNGKQYAREDAVWAEVETQPHTHPQSEVTNLVTDLAGKAPFVHTHAQADVTNLVADLSGKAPTVHTHAYADITGKPSTFPPSAHGHTTAEITGLDTALGLKANIASPIFTGDPKAPTPSAGDNDTSIATTAFVNSFVSDKLASASADLAFSFRATPHRFVWNDKADLTGADVAVMGETGKLVLGTRTLPAPANYRSALTVGGSTTHTDLTLGGKGSVIYNGYYDPVAAAYKALDAGYVGYLNFHPDSGIWYMMTSSASVAANAAVTMANRFTIGAGGGGSVNGNFYVYTPGQSLALGRGGGNGGTNSFIQYATDWYSEWDCVSGDWYLISYAGIQHRFYAAGNLWIAGATATKASGTAWVAASDERIKNVTGDYQSGLAEIRQLQPRVFTYKGNDTNEEPAGEPLYPPQAPYNQPQKTPKPGEPKTYEPAVPYWNSSHHGMATAGTEVAGFIAQEVEVVMPDLVTQGPGWIDGVEVQDFRSIDVTNLTYALVNAVKELVEMNEARAREIADLVARIEALEAA